MICVLFGCSKAEDSSEIIGGADEKTGIVVSESKTDTQPAQENTQTTEESTQSIETTIAPIINVSENQAKDIALKRLKEEYSSDFYKENGCDYTDFEFSRIDFYNYGEDRFYETLDAVKEKGHSYYDVVYRNTTELCDIAYFLIDAADGEVLFSGYMGD